MIYTYENIFSKPLLNVLARSIDSSEIDVDITEISMQDGNNYTLLVGFAEELSAGDKTILDGFVEDCEEGKLPNQKAKRIKEVDLKTRILISQGFEYSGKTFSMSVEAQINWTNLEMIKESLTYPMGASTIDDQEYIIPDATDMQNLYNTALARKKAILDGGRQLKLDINAAGNQAALDAIVDTRI